jgi:xanthine/CO dehydrogenase XdhC/CoxF family maturation factor
LSSFPFEEGGDALGPDEDVLSKALGWLCDGKRVAIATVVETWGSAPRPRGAQLAVREDGLFVGSVSGGCVEGRVIETALSAIEDHAPRTLEFGVTNEEAWDVGLPCGGTIRVFVEAVE